MWDGWRRARQCEVLYPPRAPPYTETSMPDLADRYGLALRTRSPDAVERYVQGLDLQLSLNAGGVEGLASAVVADPELALGHADLAFAYWYRSDIPAARASVQRAQALTENTSPRERQHVEIVSKFIG